MTKVTPIREKPTVKSIALEEENVVELQFRVKVRGKWKKGWYEAGIPNERLHLVTYEDGSHPIRGELPTKVRQEWKAKP